MHQVRTCVPYPTLDQTFQVLSTPTVTHALKKTEIQKISYLMHLLLYLLYLLRYVCTYYYCAYCTYRYVRTETNGET